MELTLKSEWEAIAIQDQLYDVRRDGKTLTFDKLDRAALDLAASLSNIDFPYFDNSDKSGIKCRLPYPEYERECSNQDKPKIYVACLSAYNGGYLHGLWIDATQDEEDIIDDMKWMLSWSPIDDDKCEEWDIHDHENFEGMFPKDKGLGYISKLANIIYKSEDMKAIASWLNIAISRSEEIDEEKLEKFANNFNNYYCGKWQSKEDFCANSDQTKHYLELEQLEKDHPFWSRHINWESVARELFFDNYDAIETEGGFYIFKSYHGHD
jgi:antirestriction protein